MKNLFRSVNTYFCLRLNQADFATAGFRSGPRLKTRSRIIGEPASHDKGVTQIFYRARQPVPFTLSFRYFRVAPAMAWSGTAAAIAA